MPLICELVHVGRHASFGEGDARTLHGVHREESDVRCLRADLYLGRDGRGTSRLGQIEILELLSKGLTNKTIGQALGISKFTVRNHVNRILEKLEVGDRTEASTVAIEQGILPTFH